MVHKNYLYHLAFFVTSQLGPNGKYPSWGLLPGPMLSMWK